MHFDLRFLSSIKRLLIFSPKPFLAFVALSLKHDRFTRGCMTDGRPDLSVAVHGNGVDGREPLGGGVKGIGCNPSTTARQLSTELSLREVPFDTLRTLFVRSQKCLFRCLGSYDAQRPNRHFVARGYIKQ